MLVTGDVGNRIQVCNAMAQTGQTGVLCGFKLCTLESFQFDTDRVVVAIGAAAVGRCTGMPGSVIAADKLPQGAIAPNVEVRRHLQPPDLPKVRVGVPVQLIGEQGLDLVAAVLTGRQADGVHHQ